LEIVLHEKSNEVGMRMVLAATTRAFAALKSDGSIHGSDCVTLLRHWR